MNDEISLGELVVSILRFVKKYLILLSILFAAGAAVGFFQESRVPVFYTSNIVLCSDIIKRERAEEIIMDLKNAVVQGNDSYLANKLQISEQEASQISKVDIDKFENATAYGTRARIIENQFEECTNVSISVLDKTIFSKVESGILEIFSTHPVVTQILNSRRTNIQNSKKLVLEDIEYLRNQRKKFIESLDQRKGVTDVDQFVTEGELIYAYDKVTDYSELLDRLVPAYIMKSFSEVTSDPKNYVKKMILMGVVFSLFGIFFGIYREVKI